MYRIVYVDPAQIIQAKNNTDVLKMIRSYKHYAGRGVQSWAKKVEGIIDFAPNADGEDMEYAHNAESFKVGVVIQQHGTGLDFKAFVEKFKDHPAMQSVNQWHRVHAAAEIEEVVAPLDQTMRIGSYSVEGLGELWNAADDESEAIHEYRPIDFRADRFADMKKAVARGLKGKVMSSKTKLPHRKSAYRDFAKRNQIEWD